MRPQIARGPAIDDISVGVVSKKFMPSRHVARMTGMIRVNGRTAGIFPMAYPIWNMATAVLNLLPPRFISCLRPETIEESNKHRLISGMQYRERTVRIARQKCVG
jgi:hypothetical protein